MSFFAVFRRLLDGKGFGDSGHRYKFSRTSARSGALHKKGAGRAFQRQILQYGFFPIAPACLPFKLSFSSSKRQRSRPLPRRGRSAPPRPTNSADRESAPCALVRRGDQRAQHKRGGKVLPRAPQRAAQGGKQQRTFDEIHADMRPACAATCAAPPPTPRGKTAPATARWTGSKTPSAPPSARRERR